MFTATAEKVSKFGQIRTIKDAVMYGAHFADSVQRPDMVTIEDARNAVAYAINKAGYGTSEIAGNIIRTFENEIAKSIDKQQLSLF